jgi:hypothetical protein
LLTGRCHSRRLGTREDGEAGQLIRGGPVKLQEMGAQASPPEVDAGLGGVALQQALAGLEGEVPVA